MLSHIQAGDNQRHDFISKLYRERGISCKLLQRLAMELPLCSRVFEPRQGAQ